MPGRKHKNLAAKLLLSSALVAVSLTYVWWNRHSAFSVHATLAQAPETPAASTLAPAPSSPATAAPSVSAKIEPSGAQPSTAAAQQPHMSRLPAATTAPLSALVELRMYQPPPAQVPLSLITGAPDPGAAVPIPAGAHLEDGDYLSGTKQYEWGDLQVKISIHSGQITGVQMVRYPDHRTESLEISQMASPLLGSEVIKAQRSKVDVVSSATDTSYIFQDAVADAIKKATRP